MTSDPAQTMIDELDQLLDQERQALLDGDLERIARLMETKESLIDRLNELSDIERQDLDGVRDKVTRNQALLTSAMEGIRAVADRIADLRHVRQGLATYDQSGRRQQHSTSGSQTVERRA